MRILTEYGVNDPTSQNNAKNYVEISCDSTETKPTEMVAGGSIALETDTLDLYTFDEGSETWMLTRNISGGGGGGSTEPFVVTFTITDMTSSVATADKSFTEVKEAVEAGKTVSANVNFPHGSGVTLSFDFASIPLTTIVTVPGLGVGSFIFAVTAFLAQSAQAPITFVAVMEDGNIWWKSSGND